MITLTSLFALSHSLTRSSGLGPAPGPIGAVAAQSSARQLVKLFLGYVTSQVVAKYFLSGSIVGESVAVHSLTSLCQVLLV